MRSHRAKAEVKYNELKALLIFAAKHDNRHYLNGIKLENDKLIATDGHRMLIAKLDNDTGLDLIIPRSEIETALYLHQKTYGRTKNMVAIKITKRTIGNVIYKEIDGKYPNWKSAVIFDPKDYESVNDVHVNGKYIADFARAKNLIHGGTEISIYGNKNGGSIIVNIDPEERFFGIVMPIQVPHPAKPIPKWIAKLAEEAKPIDPPSKKVKQA